MYVYGFMISKQTVVLCAGTAAIIFACTQLMTKAEDIEFLHVWQSLDIFFPRAEVWWICFALH
jgi:hypothetical protein